MVLDDPFSAIDGDTEDQVVSNLFGAQGLFKGEKTTVIILSNTSEFDRHQISFDLEADTI